MVTKFISSKAIIARLYDDYNIQSDDFTSRVPTWSLNALRLAKIKQTYILENFRIPFNEYRIKLPQQVDRLYGVKINGVRADLCLNLDLPDEHFGHSRVAGWSGEVYNHENNFLEMFTEDEGGALPHGYETGLHIGQNSYSDHEHGRDRDHAPFHTYGHRSHIHGHHDIHEHAHHHDYEHSPEHDHQLEHFNNHTYHNYNRNIGGYNFLLPDSICGINFDELELCNFIYIKPCVLSDVRYKVNNGWIHTNIESGQVEIICGTIPYLYDYDLELLFPIVPDDEDFLQMLVAYCLKNILMRGYVHPILTLTGGDEVTNPSKMYDKYRARARNSCNALSPDAKISLGKILNINII